MSINRDTTVELRVQHLVPERECPPSDGCLVVMSGARVGNRHQLTDVPVEIGRSSQCGFQLDLDSVSRKHARVEWNGSAHTVVDLGSTNGTFIEDTRVTRGVLEDGVRIRVGHVLLKYLNGRNVESAYLEEVSRLMRYDGLTGAANRVHFDDALADTVARSRRSGEPMSLLLFDLDFFKKVNDTYGHTAGDFVLRNAAKVVAAQLDEAHLLARTGGEEFAVIGRGLSLKEALPLAERLRAALAAAPCGFDGRVIPVTGSFGVATLTGEEAAGRLYERADQALYAAKAAGRNRVHAA